jgi:hypothetical protein
MEFVRANTPTSPLRKSKSATKVKELLSGEGGVPIAKNLHKKSCDALVSTILTDYSIESDKNVFHDIRIRIYDIMFLDIDMHVCMWYCVEQLMENGYMTDSQVISMMNAYMKCFIGFNINYRPIYHIERFVLTIVEIVQFRERDVSDDESGYGIDRGMFDIESPNPPNFPSNCI